MQNTSEFLQFVRPTSLRTRFLGLLLRCVHACNSLAYSYRQLPWTAWEALARRTAGNLFWQQQQQEQQQHHHHLQQPDDVSLSLLTGCLKRTCDELPPAAEPGCAASEEALGHEFASKLAVPNIQHCLSCGNMLRCQLAQRTGEHPWFYVPFEAGVQGSEWVSMCNTCQITYDIEGFQASGHVGKNEVGGWLAGRGLSGV